ncbi:MAG: F0F1 ATP synthase subunit B [Myxococcales bacterium]|nr:F0F1 ATP synthase subunit B [Myxococcales bacterium]
MAIDWFTVGAQILNFGLLVWLLKRFLYRPVLAAIDAREQKLVASLQQAQDTKAQAERELLEFRSQVAELQTKRDELMRQTHQQAQAERRRLVDEARAEAQRWSEHQHQVVAAELQKLENTFAKAVQKEVFAVSRKVMEELAAVSLETRVVEVFLERLRGIGEPEKGKLAMAWAKSEGPVVVRTTMGLTPQQKSAIAETLYDTFGVKLELTWESAPELVCGIELWAVGQKVAWNIGDRMTSLEKVAAEWMDAEKKGNR